MAKGMTYGRGDAPCWIVVPLRGETAQHRAKPCPLILGKMADDLLYLQRINDILMILVAVFNVNVAQVEEI